jgi:hypothetical protein
MSFRKQTRKPSLRHENPVIAQGTQEKGGGDLKKRENQQYTTYMKEVLQQL